MCADAIEGAMTSRATTETLRETLACFGDRGEPMTTTEVAGRLDVGRRSTYERLERLVERGHLETKKVGASARVWWRPADSDGAGDEADRTPAAEMRQFESLVEHFPNGIVTLFDEDFRYLIAGGELYERFGLSPEETVGKTLYERSTPEEVELLEPHYRAALEGVSSAFEREYAGRHIQFRTVPVTDEEGEVFAGMAMSQDVTERRERERELEEYRNWSQTLVENFPSGAIALVDERLRYVTFGGTPSGDVGVTRGDLEGAPVRDVLPDELADVVVPRYEAALDGERAEFEERIGEKVYQFHFVPVRDDDGEVFAATAMSQDVTERKERERYLAEAKSQLEAAVQAGAVGTFEWRVPEDRMVVGPSFAETFGVDPVDAREGVPLGRFTSAIHEADRERVERKVAAAVASCGEYEAEYRVRNAEGELRWVVARGHVESDDDGDPLTFPGALVDITERKRAERELARRREQLAALNDVNEVVREITEAVIDRSSREEIEETVCERLAAQESYLFAWVGEVDGRSRTVELRTEAGVEGYLDDKTISVDPDDERAGGPTGRALRTGEIQTSQDIRADDRHDPWRGSIEAYGFHSSAAIPIVHENSVYGVLNVYAERPNAFEGAERDVISQLGEVVGHAIAAVERKRALMSSEVVELEFSIEDFFGSLDVDVETSDAIRLDEVVPVRDDDFVLFGRTTPSGVETVEALVEAIPFYEGITFHDAGEMVTFELRVSEPPVLSAIASLGGSVEEAVVEDGSYRLRVHLSPSADVSRVVDVMRETYPSAALLKRRQLTVRERGVDADSDAFTSTLTDRQRAAVETAYHAGFFEWPRDASGEDVADLLGVAAPTFHQHLRKAEKKLLESSLRSSRRP